jgi:hypothetical protein
MVKAAFGPLVRQAPRGPTHPSPETAPGDAPPEIPPTGEYSLTVPLKDIYYDAELNIRKEFHPTAMDRLGQSMTQDGQYQSVLLSPVCAWWKGGPDGEPWLLVQGSRRYLSAKAIGKESLIAIVKTFPTLADALAANMAENVLHEPVSLYETVMRVHRFTRQYKTLHDPVVMANPETVTIVAKEIANKTGVNLDLCIELVSMVELVSPDIWEKLRYDETKDMIARIEKCKSVGHDSVTRMERWEKQVEWWEAEGWKGPKQVKTPHTASHAKIMDIAAKIRAAKVIRGRDGKLLDLREDVANALADALEWCASPKGKKAPL